MERTSTFANIGHRINPNTTFTANGLPTDFDFSVDKRPVYYEDNENRLQRLKGTSTIVDQFGKAYGAVSDKYEPIDNATALGSVPFIEGLTLEKYGSAYNGMQYLIGSLPQINVLGDTFTPYLIFRNSFDGRFPIQATICPLRIVCQNQFAMAFRKAENKINIRHTKSAVGKLEEAHKILISTAEYLNEFKAQLEGFATTKITTADFNRIVEHLFPLKPDMSERTQTTVKNNILAFRTAFAMSDNANFTDSLMGVVNAYSDYLTHSTNIKKTATADDNRFIAVTFDIKAMTKLLEIARSVVI